MFLEYDSYNLNGHSGFEVLYEYKDISGKCRFLVNPTKTVDLSQTMKYNFLVNKTI